MFWCRGGVSRHRSRRLGWWALVLVLAPAAARAAESPSACDTPAPASRGIELGVELGYAQPVGDLQTTSGAGYAMGLDAGYRLTPRATLGAYGAVSQFARGDALPSGSHVGSVAAGARFDYHARPESSLDPWMSFGAGWRDVWIAHDGAGGTAVHGISLSRVLLGVDYRVTRDVAMAPFVGFDTSLLFAGTGPDRVDSQVSVFVFAGVMARFDLGGRADQP